MFSTLLLSTLLTVFSSGTDAGLRIGVSQNALTQAKNDLLPILIKNIKSITVPNIHDQIGSGFLSVSVDLTNIKVSGLKVDVQKSNLDFKNNNRIELTIVNIGAQGSGNFAYKASLIQGSGSAKFSLLNTSAQIVIIVDEKNGKLDFQITQNTVTIGDINVSTNGDVLVEVANWIADQFKGLIKSQIEDLLGGALKDQISTGLNKFIQGLPSYAPIPGTKLEVNYMLTEKPLITNKMVIDSLNGLVLYTKNPNDNPPINKRRPLPEFNSSKQGVELLISDYVINSALYSAYQANLLHFNISSSIIPSSSPIQLNTNFLEGFVPGIVEKFGADQPVDLIITGLNNPQVTLNGLKQDQKSGNLQGSLKTQLGLSVRGKGIAVDLDATVDFNSGLYEKDWEIKGALDTIDVSGMKATHSAVSGKIDVDGLQTTLNFLFKVALPVINGSYLQGGIPLPKLKFVNLNQSQLAVEDGYIDIEAIPVFDFGTRMDNPIDYGSEKNTNI